MEKIIDGKRISFEIREEIKSEVILLEKRGIKPGLAVVLVGENPASKIYVKNKRKACEELDIESFVFELTEDVSENEVVSVIKDLNVDDKVHGILVQLPLPAQLDEKRIIGAIDPKKDVDCFHPENAGKMFLGYPQFLPCTPAGVIELLKRSEIELEGKDCVIVGRSNIVGKPLGILLLDENATVTMAHSKTVDLALKIKNADIVISAVGKPGFITGEMIKNGAVVIDVGINRLSNGKVVGDVDFESVSKVSSAITPVPGGVGPMTIAMLMKNTLKAAKEFGK